MKFTFDKKFIVLGYRENSYTKDDKLIEQYILNIAFEYEKYKGLHVGQAFVSKEVFKDINIGEHFENTLFNATCSYNKNLKRLYIENINSMEEVGWYVGFNPFTFYIDLCLYKIAI